MRFQIIFAAALRFANAHDSQEELKDIPEKPVADFVAPEVDLPEFIKTTISAPFLEQFTEGLKNWIPSTAKKMIDGVEDQDLLQYRGEWSVESPLGELIKGDQGLVLKTLAAHSAISSKFPKVLDPKGKSLVVQYEVKAQNGMECGGAYMKLLSFDKRFTPEKFSDQTPYTIMFGPDKCGSNNKVHFIFRHQNPITKKFEEKHLTSPPTVPSGTMTNLYTLIVNPDQGFEILVNNESVSKGSLLKDFTPPVNPEKTIPDPNETEPEDWVHEKEIADPKATKPEDWDEDAPAEIVDESAKMPEDWLESEPDYIPDPETKMPEDWDEEEDGDWTAPTIANPKCADVSGCGPWKKPTIANPKYKGKWNAPMIPNPAYKGEWKPKQIPNPEYFVDEKPSDFTPIGAVGFELWSMQDGFIFDNIYIGHSAADAKTLAEESWAIKKKAEDVKIINEKQDEKETGEGLLGKAALVFEVISGSILEFIDVAKVDPVGAVKEMPQIAITLLSGVLALLLFATMVLGKKSPVVATKEVKKDAKKDVVEEKEEIAEKETKKSTKRSPKKD